MCREKGLAAAPPSADDRGPYERSYAKLLGDDSDTPARASSGGRGRGRGRVRPAGAADVGQASGQRCIYGPLSASSVRGWRPTDVLGASACACWMGAESSQHQLRWSWLTGHAGRHAHTVQAAYRESAGGGLQGLAGGPTPRLMPQMTPG